MTLIYIIGDPPPWLIELIKELGETFARVNSCDIPPRSIIIVVDANVSCNAKGSIVLSLIPLTNSIFIDKSIARGVLRVSIDLLRKAESAASIRDAMALLGFKRISINGVTGGTEIIINDQVLPGSIYTLTAFIANEHKQGIKAVLGRGTVRNTLIIDSSVGWFMKDSNEIYMAKGDLLLELLLLSMVFGAGIEFPNPPY